MGVLMTSFTTGALRLRVPSSWGLCVGRGRAHSLQMPSIYSDTVKGRGEASWAMSNSSVDVGYRVGSAAEDQIADSKRVRLSTGEEAVKNCSISIYLFLGLLGWT